jgi:hypothetical protein
MRLQIVNDKKLNWSYVKKVVVQITSDTLAYEEPLTIADIAMLHFTTGKLLEEYYAGDKK